MKITQNISRIFMVAILFVAAVSCTTQDDFVKPVEQPEAVVATSDEGAADVASVTVSGAFTEYRDEDLCASCTYVIPEDATIIDGAELKLEAGDVICLKKGVKYKAIELVNVEGTAEQPIIIGNCSE
jgi:hypothetical protein